MLYFTTPSHTSAHTSRKRMKKTFRSFTSSPSRKSEKAFFPLCRRVDVTVGGLFRYFLQGGEGDEMWLISTVEQLGGARHLPFFLPHRVLNSDITSHEKIYI